MGKSGSCPGSGVAHLAPLTLFRLSDLENGVLGVPPLHMDRLLAWKRCTNVWEADVVGFGAVLYEMVVGEELPAEGLPARYPDGTSERVKDVLDSIFRPAKPLPTVDDLLKTAYFASIEMVRHRGRGAGAGRGRRGRGRFWAPRWASC